MTSREEYLDRTPMIKLSTPDLKELMALNDRRGYGNMNAIVSALLSIRAHKKIADKEKLLTTPQKRAKNSLTRKWQTPHEIGELVSTLDVLVSHGLAERLLGDESLDKSRGYLKYRLKKQ